jgi:hypothetical protein
MKAKYAGAFLPDQLDRKYKYAARELIWQWFFPAPSLNLVPKTQEYKRYHLHETVVQKAIKQAVSHAKITKRASAHTLAPFLCTSFIAGKLRYSYDSRIAGAFRFDTENLPRRIDTKGCCVPCCKWKAS